VIYAIRHLTAYAYSRPVPFARCILRVLPRDGAGQRVLTSQLAVTPRGAERQDGVCFFGNRTTTLMIARPHRELRIEMTSRVEVTRAATPFPALTRRWEEVIELALSAQSLSPDSPAQYLYPSRLAPIVDEITAYARESFPAKRPVFEAASELMGRIRKEFRYDPEATEVATPIREASRRATASARTSPTS
jgi:transglutaminase-like putative cysteine protease